MMDQALDQDNLIKSGVYVIISTLYCKKVNKLVKVDPDNDVYIKKNRISLKGLIGKSFGSVYEFDTHTMQLKCTNLNEEQLLEIYNSFLIDDEESDDDYKDNRFIIDDSSSQKLTKDDIEVLKEEGLSGNEIVKSLVENSSTFKVKTRFSQEKYLKRKREKYSNLIRVQRPTIALLTEMYYAQGPQKINNLRIDSLSQMLTYSNVRSGCKYLVVDTNMGLLTAAVIDRLIGNGSVVSSGYNSGHCVQIYADCSFVSTWRQSVEALNLPEEALRSCLSSFNLIKAMKLLNCNDQSCEEKIIEKNEMFSNEDESKRKKFEERAKRRLLRQMEEERAKKLLMQKDFDGLLIVCRNYDCNQILDILYHFVSPSQSICIFSPFMEPLLNCFKLLKGKAVNIKINETWLRHYRVLAGRTRPEMNMSGSGGYILTALKVCEE